MIRSVVGQGSAAGTSDPVVTIGIINFNRAALTLQTLAQILAQEGIAERKVVVVDNGSSDLDGARLTAGIGDHVRLVRLPTNRGYAAACNAIAKVAIEYGSQFVWFLNNDVEMDPTVLTTLLAALDADRSAIAVAPVTVDAEDGTTVLGAGGSITLWRGRIVHRYASQSVESLPLSPYAVEVIEGAGPLIRTSSLRDVGAWDEGFFMYWEDVEWSVRARRSGGRLLVAPGARLRHQVSASSTPVATQEAMLRNRVRFMRIAAPPWAQPIFLVYFSCLWLPAFYVTRLVPRFGLRAGARVALTSLSWNLRDAVRRRRWRLRRSDQQIPNLSP
jgi:GT2 family glycosyltransferase